MSIHCNSILTTMALYFLTASAFAADTPTALIDGVAYTRAQQMVEVEPGRRLNLYCVGTGSPTVVFEAGLGVPISNWGFVQPVISQMTRTCSYDRAGLGFSDAGTRAANSENIVDDLHRLLVAAAIKPPYVLVGHSYGGLTVRLYAHTYSSEVVGMVLVDPTVEDQTEAYRALDPKKRTIEQWAAYAIEPNLRDGRECVAAAPAGFVRGTELFKKCISEPFAQYSETVNATNQRQEMQLAAQQAGLSENEQVFGASSDQVRAARRSYGDLPLIVLTSGPRPQPKQPLTLEAQALSAARRQVAVALHEDVAKLSNRGISEVVPGSRHYIQLDRPQAVIDAITRVLAMTKGLR
jgi:pimeloyl-ACP methyl ester carboxylesterase